MVDSNLQKDTDAINKLHRGFCAANTSADWPFLEKNVAPGDVLVWYNLNQSNYLGLDHIVELWKMLASASGEGARAIMEPRDDEITIIGDAALVTYLIHFAADFGSLGKVSQEVVGLGNATRAGAVAVVQKFEVRLDVFCFVMALIPLVQGFDVYRADFISLVEEMADKETADKTAATCDENKFIGHDLKCLLVTRLTPPI